MNTLKSIFFASILSTMLFSCADEVLVPAFVKVEGFYLDSTSYDSVGTTDSRIEYAWMYINNNLQGVYKLPFLVPVQNYGEVNIELRPGIPQLQIIGGTGAAVYPFYKYWNGKATLNMNDTTVLKPNISYKNGLLFQYKDDFEMIISPSNLFQKYGSEGIFQYINNPTMAYEGQGYGELLLLEGETECLMANAQLWDVPKTRPAYYIEMNYQCNTPFVVGLQTAEQTIEVVTYYKTDEWKKVYLDITSQVKGLAGAGLRFYIKIKRGEGETGVKTVLIDNFKLLY